MQKIFFWLGILFFFSIFLIIFTKHYTNYTSTIHILQGKYRINKKNTTKNITKNQEFTFKPDPGSNNMLVYAYFALGSTKLNWGLKTIGKDGPIGQGLWVRCEGTEPAQVSNPIPPPPPTQSPHIT